MNLYYPENSRTLQLFVLLTRSYNRKKTTFFEGCVFY